MALVPSVESNLEYWGTAYSWSEQGDEWSAPWGGTETLWYATLLPRIRHFLPAESILEIAPGYGRWSQFLIDASDRYVGVDIAESCIRFCSERFADRKHASFVVNDGRSLDSVPDASVDFAFSFDSLVHVEVDVMASYVRELGRTLTPDGIAFLHHSNLGEYAGPAKRAATIGRLTGKVPVAGRGLRKVRVTGWDNSRAPSMSAAALVGLCDEAGVRCVGQELISWDKRSRRTIDCLSLVTRPGSRWDRPNVVVRNPRFVDEAASARALGQVFTSLAPTVPVEAS